MARAYTPDALYAKYADIAVLSDKKQRSTMGTKQTELLIDLLRTFPVARDNMVLLSCMMYEIDSASTFTIAKLTAKIKSLRMEGRLDDLYPKASAAPAASTQPSPPVDTTPQNTPAAPTIADLLTYLKTSQDPTPSPVPATSTPVPRPSAPSAPLTNANEAVVPRAPPTASPQMTPPGYAPRPVVPSPISMATQPQLNNISTKDANQTTPRTELRAPSIFPQRETIPSAKEGSQPQLNDSCELSPAKTGMSKKRAAPDEQEMHEAHDRISARRWNPMTDDSICIQLDISNRESGMVGLLNWRYHGDKVTVSISTTTGDHVSLRYSDFDQNIQIGVRRTVDPRCQLAFEKDLLPALPQGFSDTFYCLKLSSGVVEPSEKGHYTNSDGITHFWVLPLEETFVPTSSAESRLRAKYA